MPSANTTQYRHARQWLRKLCQEQPPFQLRFMGTSWAAVQCGSGMCHAVQLMTLVETGPMLPLGIQEVLRGDGWGPKLLKLLKTSLQGPQVDIVRILEESLTDELANLCQEDYWSLALSEIVAIRSKDYTVWEPGHLGQIQVGSITRGGHH